MKKLLCLLMCVPLFGRAQDKNKGIKFEQGLSWEQVKAKAKAENKYIFVDCYATWCGPCKEMDRDVYPAKKIGALVDSMFIAVKMQMDTSKADDLEIKTRYADAHYISEQYKISSMPTYLFFSPAGKLVHRDEAFKTVDQFAQVLKNAINPHQQLYTLLDNYWNGVINRERVPDLALTLRKFDPRLGDSIAQKYVENNLADQAQPLYTKSTTDFIAQFPDLLYSSKAAWNFFYRHRRMVDSVQQAPGFANSVINNAINTVEVYPALNFASQHGTEPDWRAIDKSIKSKFDAGFARESVLDAKINWYKNKKDWISYIKCLESREDLVGIDKMDPEALNNDAWDVFQYSNNPKQLRKALSWSDLALKKANDHVHIVAWTDTKANLLYKLNRKQEAIELETQVVAMEHKYAAFAQTLEKMKKGLPTW
ncbi:MAG TPA: thioredoxin family protein [Mucilaginibacter sp.]|nr:thioredoxin family protein [Mucilaginibacter sp.]